MRNKGIWLEEALSVSSPLPAAVCVTETHLDATSKMPPITGYDIWHAGTSTQSCGVAIYYRAVLKVK
jgi:hypothetical protein